MDASFQVVSHKVGRGSASLGQGLQFLPLLLLFLLPRKLFLLFSGHPKEWKPRYCAPYWRFPLANQVRSYNCTFSNFIWTKYTLKMYTIALQQVIIIMVNISMYLACHLNTLFCCFFFSFEVKQYFVLGTFFSLPFAIKQKEPRDVGRLKYPLWNMGRLKSWPQASWCWQTSVRKEWIETKH